MRMSKLERLETARAALGVLTGASLLALAMCSAKAAEVCMEPEVCIDGGTMVYDGHSLYFEGRVGSMPVWTMLDCVERIGTTQAQGQPASSGAFGEKSVAAKLCELAEQKGKDQGI